MSLSAVLGRTRVIVYDVYEQPNPPPGLLDRAQRLVFVKDAFIWTAAIVPALWLLFKTLWLELLVFLCAVSALAWGLEKIGIPNETTGAVLLIVQIIFGFEAASIYRAALERRGWRHIGTVTGRNTAVCERRFFDSWLPSQPEALPAGPNDASGLPPSWKQAAWTSARDAASRWVRPGTAKA